MAATNQVACIQLGNPFGSIPTQWSKLCRKYINISFSTTIFNDPISLPTWRFMIHGAYFDDIVVSFMTVVADLQQSVPSRSMPSLPYIMHH